MTAKHYTQRDTAVADVTLGAAQVQFEGGLGVSLSALPTEVVAA